MFRSLRNDAVYRESRAQLRRARPRECATTARWRAHQRSSAGAASGSPRGSAYEFRRSACSTRPGPTCRAHSRRSATRVLMEYVGDGDGRAAAARGDVSRVRRRSRSSSACCATSNSCSPATASTATSRPTTSSTGRARSRIIDFAQAVDPRYNRDVYPLLARDIERVCRYFARYGVEADAAALAADLWERYLRGEV